MKVAILYICTGRYACFFPGFYESAERCLLPEARKHYYVWTDDDALADGLDNVTLIHKECAGFPADSLFKFDLFLQVEEELRQYDYVYFMNSNTEAQENFTRYATLKKQLDEAVTAWEKNMEELEKLNI